MLIIYKLSFFHSVRINKLFSDLKYVAIGIISFAIVMLVLLLRMSQNTQKESKPSRSSSMRKKKKLDDSTYQKPFSDYEEPSYRTRGIYDSAATASSQNLPRPPQRKPPIQPPSFTSVPQSSYDAYEFLVDQQPDQKFFAQQYSHDMPPYSTEPVNQENFKPKIIKTFNKNQRPSYESYLADLKAKEEKRKQRKEERKEKKAAKQIIEDDLEAGSKSQLPESEARVPTGGSVALLEVQLGGTFDETLPEASRYNETLPYNERLASNAAMIYNDGGEQVPLEFAPGFHGELPMEVLQYTEPDLLDETFVDDFQTEVDTRPEYEKELAKLQAKRERKEQKKKEKKERKKKKKIESEINEEFLRSETGTTTTGDEQTDTG